jgi:hypothetical protein
MKKKEAAAAMARFVSLHRYNIAQKTEVIIGHFRHQMQRRARALLAGGRRGDSRGGSRAPARHRRIATTALKAATRKKSRVVERDIAARVARVEDEADLFDCPPARASPPRWPPSTSRRRWLSHVSLTAMARA